MNTRLQVEHPVTEAVTGLDLVRLQLLIAEGARCRAEVHDAPTGPQGHAIEARLYAEDPARRWLPSTGTLHRFEVPAAPGRRIACGSTAASSPARWSARTTTPCWPRSSPMHPPAAEAISALAARSARARIHGRHHQSRPAGPDPAPPGVRRRRHRHRLPRSARARALAAPLVDGDALERHALAAALAGQAARRRCSGPRRRSPPGTATTLRRSSAPPIDRRTDADRRRVPVRPVRQPSLVEVEIDGSTRRHRRRRSCRAEWSNSPTGGVARPTGSTRSDRSPMSTGPTGPRPWSSMDRSPLPGDRIAEGLGAGPDARWRWSGWRWRGRQVRGGYSCWSSSRP